MEKNKHGIEKWYSQPNDETLIAYKFFITTSGGLLLPFAKKKCGYMPVGVELTAPDVLAPDATRNGWPRGWYTYATLGAARQAANDYAADGRQVEVREVRLRGLEVEGYEAGLPVVTGIRMTVLQEA